jgi:Family of unknown function (DUF6194)
VTEAELIELLTELPDTDVLTADEASGAPEIAWGDTFATYAGAKQPFATIVAKDYGDFDDASKLDRDGVFRLNVAVGRERFIELLGYAPGSVPAGIDYTVFDTVLPHPVYAPQAFVCVVNPGEQARALIEFAHARAAAARA